MGPGQKQTAKRPESKPGSSVDQGVATVHNNSIRNSALVRHVRLFVPVLRELDADRRSSQLQHLQLPLNLHSALNHHLHAAQLAVRQDLDLQRLCGPHVT